MKISNAHFQNKNYFLPDGKINFQGINNLSGVFAGPMIHAVWSIADNSPDTITRFHSLLCNLQKQDLKAEIVDILLLFNDLFNFALYKDITEITTNSEALDFFISELVLDMDDVIQELVSDE
jgi:hypothetical protein